MYRDLPRRVFGADSSNGGWSEPPIGGVRFNAVLPIRKKAEELLANRLVRLPLSIVRLWGARRPISVDGNQLDPRYQFITSVVGRSQRPLNELPVAEAREQYRRMRFVFEDERPSLARVEDLGFAGPGGEITVRIYADSDSTGLPVAIYFHGGGGVFGDLDTHDYPCRVLAQRGRCLVISVDYRLAPEDPFPAGLEDAVAAVQWARGSAHRFGGDGSRLAVVGDSMGANLAAVACQELAASSRCPDFQLLIYPLTNFNGQARSRRLFYAGYLLTENLLRWCSDHYLAGADPSDPRASPLRRGNLRGLPPALVVTAGFDPLRDEGREYARRLEAAGVNVRHHCFGEQVHGFAQMPAVPSAKAALNRIGDELARALHDG